MSKQMLWVWLPIKHVHPASLQAKSTNTEHKIDLVDNKTLRGTSVDTKHGETIPVHSVLPGLQINPYFDISGLECL